MTNYMLLGYGREYELEADEVGLRYARRAGYDPRRMVTMLRWMRRNDMLRGQRLYHGFDATHPDTATRIAKADTMATLLIAEKGPLEVGGNEFRTHLDGLRYGEAKDQRRVRTYVVKPGDTLASIARSELNNEGRRFELASLNDLRDDAVPAPGTRLKLVVAGDWPWFDGPEADAPVTRRLPARRPGCTARLTGPGSTAAHRCLGPSFPPDHRRVRPPS